MILLICNDGLIGDFLGVLPVMTELAKQEELHISIHPEAQPIFHLVPKKYDIRLQERERSCYNRILELDISKAFTISHERNYYMSQSHFACLGMDVPEKPPKADLTIERVEAPICDYVLAPFSRSLPPQQRWPQAQWQRLVELMPASTFCIIGHQRDERDFVTGSNVIQMYNESIMKLINLLKNAGKGLISVVSGPSHLAFHLEVKNYLLTNQSMSWGNNPDAVKIGDYIPELKAEKLMEVLAGS